MTEPPPSEGRLAAAASVVRSLSLTNVLIIALLVAIAIPAYIIYRAVNDPAVMNRLLSSYQELPNQQSGCTLRTVRERGGPQRWSVSTGFAFHGADRWSISVLLDYEPTGEQITSYCETLKLIADRTLMAPKL